MTRILFPWWSRSTLFYLSQHVHLSIRSPLKSSLSIFSSVFVFSFSFPHTSSTSVLGHSKYITQLSYSFCLLNSLVRSSSPLYSSKYFSWNLPFPDFQLIFHYFKRHISLSYNTIGLIISPFSILTSIWLFSLVSSKFFYPFTIIFSISICSSFFLIITTARYSKSLSKQNAIFSSIWIFIFTVSVMTFFCTSIY